MVLKTQSKVDKTEVVSRINSDSVRRLSFPHPSLGVSHLQMFQCFWRFFIWREIYVWNWGERRSTSFWSLMQACTNSCLCNLFYCRLGEISLFCPPRYFPVRVDVHPGENAFSSFLRTLLCLDGRLHLQWNSFCFQHLSGMINNEKRCEFEKKIHMKCENSFCTIALPSCAPGPAPSSSISTSRSSSSPSGRSNRSRLGRTYWGHVLILLSGWNLFCFFLGGVYSVNNIVCLFPP